MRLEAGQQAPGFDLPSNKEYNITLDSLKGKNVILYFYPKDNTPGCTKEACGFRDIYQALSEKGIAVIGMSRDDTATHRKFADKHNLPFILLSDLTGETVENYGVWVEKNNYGKKYMGIERTTFLINEDGIIEKEWRKVNPGTHMDEILNYINNHQT